jgi:hypothetical protein
MAVYRIFPEKDAFISSEYPLSNTGLDEIVELGGYPDFSNIGQTSRILVKYRTSEIQDVIANKVTGSYTASLNMYLADSLEIPVNYSIYAHPISGAWDNGTGKYGDLPTNSTGVSWTYRNANLISPWSTSNFTAGVTASFKSTQVGGGTWYTASNGVNLTFTQSHDTVSSQDVSIDVTRAITLHNVGTIVNDGFIIKLQDSLESQNTSSINIKYYSLDTNTIYPSFLEFKWDDSVYNTGSLSVLNNSISIVNLTNNTGRYTDSGKQRFRLSTRPKYPPRSFTTSSAYLINYALPSASYWGIRDENTEEMLIDFDTRFTKISCDSNGSFFDVYMDGLQPERYYRILVKTTLDGSTTVIDNQNIFKVVRNG